MDLWENKGIFTHGSLGASPGFPMGPTGPYLGARLGGQGHPVRARVTQGETSEGIGNPGKGVA